MERRSHATRSSDEKSPSVPKKAVKLCRAGPQRGKKANDEAAEQPPAKRRTLRRSTTSQPVDLLKVKIEPEEGSTQLQPAPKVSPRRRGRPKNAEVTVPKVNTALKVKIPFKQPTQTARRKSVSIDEGSTDTLCHTEGSASSDNTNTPVNIASTNESSRVETPGILSSPASSLGHHAEVKKTPGRIKQAVCKKSEELAQKKRVTESASTDSSRTLGSESTKQKAPGNTSSQSSYLSDYNNSLSIETNQSACKKSQELPVGITDSTSTQACKKPTKQEAPQKSASQGSSYVVACKKPDELPPQRTIQETATLSLTAPGKPFTQSCPLLNVPDQDKPGKERDESSCKMSQALAPQQLVNETSKDSPRILESEELAKQPALGKASSQGSSLVNAIPEKESPIEKKSVCENSQELAPESTVSTNSKDHSSTLVSQEQCAEDKTSGTPLKASGSGVSVKAAQIARFACSKAAPKKMKLPGVVITREVRGNVPILDQTTLGKCLTLLDRAHSSTLTFGGLVIERSPSSTTPQGDVELWNLVSLLREVEDYSLSFICSKFTYTEVKREKQEQGQEDHDHEAEEQELRELVLEIERVDVTFGPLEVPSLPYGNSHLTLNKRMCQPTDFGAGVATSGFVSGTQPVATPSPSPIITTMEDPSHQRGPATADISLRRPIGSSENVAQKVLKDDGSSKVQPIESVSVKVEAAIQEKQPSKITDPTSACPVGLAKTEEQQCQMDSKRQPTPSSGCSVSVMGAETVAVPSSSLTVSTAEKELTENSHASPSLTVTSADTGAFSTKDHPIGAGVDVVESSGCVRGAVQVVTSQSADPIPLHKIDLEHKKHEGSTADTIRRTQAVTSQPASAIVSDDHKHPKHVGPIKVATSTEGPMRGEQTVTSQAESVIVSAKMDDQQKTQGPPKAPDVPSGYLAKGKQAVGLQFFSPIVTAKIDSHDNQEQQGPTTAAESASPIISAKLDGHEKQKPQVTKTADTTSVRLVRREQTVSSESTTPIKTEDQEQQKTKGPNKTDVSSDSLESGNVSSQSSMTSAAEIEDQDHEKHQGSTQELTDPQKCTADEETHMDQITATSSSVSSETVASIVATHSTNPSVTPTSEGHRKVSTETVSDPKLIDKQEAAVQNSSAGLATLSAEKDELKLQVQQKSSSDDEGTKRRLAQAENSNVTDESTGTDGSSTSHGTSDSGSKLRSPKKRKKIKHQNAVQGVIHPLDEQEKSLLKTKTLHKTSAKPVKQNEIVSGSTGKAKTTTTIKEENVETDLKIPHDVVDKVVSIDGVLTPGRIRNLTPKKPSVCLEHLEQVHFKSLPDIWARVRSGRTCSYQQIFDNTNSTGDSEKASENMTSSISESLSDRSADREVTNVRTQQHPLDISLTDDEVGNRLVIDMSAEENVLEEGNNKKGTLSPETDNVGIASSKMAAVKPTTPKKASTPVKTSTPKKSSTKKKKFTLDISSTDDEVSDRLVIDMSAGLKVKKEEDEADKTGPVSSTTNQAEITCSKQSEVKSPTPKKKQEKPLHRKHRKHSTSKDHAVPNTDSVKLPEKGKEKADELTIDASAEKRDKTAVAADEARQVQTPSKEPSVSTAVTHSKPSVDKTSSHKTKHREKSKSSHHKHHKHSSTKDVNPKGNTSSTKKDSKTASHKRHHSTHKDLTSDTVKTDEKPCRKEFDIGAEVFKQNKTAHSHKTKKNKSIGEHGQKHRRHSTDSSKSPTKKKPKLQEAEKKKSVKTENSNDGNPSASEVPTLSNVPNECNVTTVPSPEGKAFEMMVSYSDKSLDTLMHQIPNTPPPVSVSFPPLRRPSTEVQPDSGIEVNVTSSIDQSDCSPATQEDDSGPVAPKDVIPGIVEPVEDLEEGEILDDSKELPAAYKLDDPDTAADGMDDSDACSSSTETSGSRKRKWSSGGLKESKPTRKKLKRPFRPGQAFTPLHQRVQRAIKIRDKSLTETEESIDLTDISIDLTNDEEETEAKQMPDEGKLVKIGDRKYPVRKKSEETSAEQTAETNVTSVTHKGETNVTQQAEAQSVVPEDTPCLPPSVSGREQLLQSYLADNAHSADTDDDWRDEDVVSFYAPSEASFLFDEELDALEEQRDRGTREVPTVTSYPVTSRPVVPHNVMSRPVVTHPVALPPVTSHTSTSHPVRSHPLTSHHEVSRPAMSHPARSDPVTSHTMVSRPATSHPVRSHPVTSHPMVSHSVISPPVVHPLTSHPVTSPPVVSPPVVPHPVTSRTSLSPPLPPPITRTVTAGLPPPLQNWQIPDMSRPPPVPPFTITKPPVITKQRLLPHNVNLKPTDIGVILPDESRNLQTSVAVHPPFNPQNFPHSIPIGPSSVATMRPPPLPPLSPYQQRGAPLSPPPPPPPPPPQKKTETPPPPPPPPAPANTEVQPPPPPPKAFCAVRKVPAGAKYKPLRIHELPPWEIKRVVDRLQVEKGQSPNRKLDEKSCEELEKIFKALTKQERWTDIVELSQDTATKKLLPVKHFLTTMSEALISSASHHFKELLATAQSLHGDDMTKPLWRWLTGLGVSLLVAADIKHKQLLAYQVVQTLRNHKLEYVKNGSSQRYPPYAILYMAVDTAMSQGDNMLAVDILDDNKWLIPEVGHQSERGFRERRLTCLKGLITHFKNQLSTPTSQENARKVLFQILDTLLRSYVEDQDMCAETIPKKEVGGLQRVLLESAMKAKHCEQALEVNALLTKHGLTKKLPLDSRLRQQLIYFVNECSKTDSRWFDVAAKLAVEATKGGDKKNRLYPHQLTTSDWTKPRIYLSPYMPEFDMFILMHGILVELLDRIINSKDNMPIENAQFQLRIDLVADSNAAGFQYQANGSVHEAHERLRMVLRDRLKPPLTMGDADIERMHITSDSLKGFLQALYNKRRNDGCSLFAPQRDTGTPNAYWEGPPDAELGTSYNSPSRPTNIPVLNMMQGIVPMGGGQMDPRRAGPIIVPQNTKKLTWPEQVMLNNQMLNTQMLNMQMLNSQMKGPEPDSALMPPPTWTPQRPEREPHGAVPQTRSSREDTRGPVHMHRPSQHRHMHREPHGRHTNTTMNSGGAPFGGQRGGRPFDRQSGGRQYDGHRGRRQFDGQRGGRQFDGQRGGRQFDGQRGGRHTDRHSSSDRWRGGSFPYGNRGSFNGHPAASGDRRDSKRPASSGGDKRNMDRPTSSGGNRRESDRPAPSGGDRGGSEKPASLESERTASDRPPPLVDERGAFDTDRPRRREFWGPPSVDKGSDSD